MTRRKKIIVNLAGKGDIVNTTMFPRLYKENGYDEVIWIAFRKNLGILKGNPYIDRLVAAEDIVDNSYVRDSNHVVATALLRKQLEESDHDCVFPAPYCHTEYNGGTDVSLLNYIRKRLISEFNLKEETVAEHLPQIFLSEDEIAEARTFFDALPKVGKIILVEHETFSDQTFINTEDLLTLARNLRKDSPELFFVFTGFRQISEDGIISYNGSYKSNAELYNLCDGFISVGSGISCLIYSDYCPTDKPTMEIIRGRHWSSYDYAHKKNKLFITNPSDLITGSEIFMRKINER